MDGRAFKVKERETRHLHHHRHQVEAEACLLARLSPLSLSLSLPSFFPLGREEIRRRESRNEAAFINVFSAKNLPSSRSRGGGGETYEEF